MDNKLKLNVKDSELFLQTLTDKSEPNEKLKEAVKRYLEVIK